MKFKLDFNNKDNWAGFRKFLRWLIGAIFIFISIRDLFSSNSNIPEQFSSLLLGLYLLPPVFTFIVNMLPKFFDFGKTFNRIIRYTIAIGLYIVWMNFGLISIHSSPSYKKEVKAQEIEKQKQEVEKVIDGHKSGAYLTAQDLVKAKLSYPEEADFPFSPSIPIVVNGDIYKVQGYVNTKNGFGVKIKAKFVCILKYIGGDDLSPYSWEEQATTVFE